MAQDHRGALGASLDTQAVVRYFGGADELAFALRKHKVAKISGYAVKQWCTRKRIPFLRRLDLQALAQKMGKKDFDLTNFRLKVGGNA